MRVLVLGATGVLGRPLVPVLMRAGHEVIATSRRAERLRELERLGAQPLVVDALDAAAMRAAVEQARPDAVAHMLTAIPADLTPRRYAGQMTATNRLRTEGTRNLLDALGERAGSVRLISQSIAFVYAPQGPAVLDEDAPLNVDALPPMTETVRAVAELERLTRDAGGTVLRFGYLYGPDTAYAPGGSVIEMIRGRRFPIVGDGTGMFSFLHVNDAATATLAALDGPAGIYNIVDDDPAPAKVWIPEVARLIGASPPRRVPVWLARLFAGGVAREAARLRGASNARARRDLGWEPRLADWREGFAQTLVESGPRSD